MFTLAIINNMINTCSFLSHLHKTDIPNATKVNRYFLHFLGFVVVYSVWQAKVNANLSSLSGLHGSIPQYPHYLLPAR